MTVTIRDVARKAGVSPITVSRAFSGTHPVAEETRRKVLKVAEEMGYVPDLLARALVHKQSPIIGVVVLELVNPFFVHILDAVQAVTRQKDHMLLVSQSERQPDMERASVHQFRQMRVAGILITPATTEMGHLRLLEAEGTPVVVVARRWDDGDCVTVDDFAGGRIAGEHLVQLGHRKIGCVAHDELHNVAVQDRVQGFQHALREAGCVFSPQCTLHTKTLRMADAIQAADAFLDLPERPTAVFVTADRLAIGFVHRLREKGLRVPGDVAVVGYDDIRYAEFMEVPLTTVALPKYEMGQQAAQLLFELIEASDADNEPRRIMLEPQLIVRASCGAHSTGGYQPSTHLPLVPYSHSPRDNL
jgi:LacI family transcriptional regulator